MATSIELRYRWLYKPLLHIACLVPLAWCIGGALGLPHVPGLGVEPARKVLGILGHTGLNLLLCTLAITPLRQLTGNPHLLRLRRTLGVYAFVYVLLHFTDYMGIQGFSLHAILADIAKRPYITLGFTALVLLVPMAITSTNGMIRRLRTRWRTIQSWCIQWPCWACGTTGGRSRRTSASRCSMRPSWRCCWAGASCATSCYIAVRASHSSGKSRSRSALAR